MLRPEAIDGFLVAGPAALVKVETARGSTPREAGAWMLVSRAGALGTIGGGQLEFVAIDAARAMLARGGGHETLDVPLGPEIGQCCGGRTLISIGRVDDSLAAGLRAEAADRARALPEVLVFGAGHVGRALAASLALLPLRPVLIDSRAEALDLAPAGVETRATPLPEAEVRGARPGSAFVLLTHDHALDFLIAREALARGDAAYVGMIGSATKRATFARWCRGAGAPPPDPARLVCPIGAAGRPDKRPEVIAAFAAAEILASLRAAAPVTQAWDAGG